MTIIKAKPYVHRPLTEEMLEAAIKRGEARQASSLQAVSVTFEKPTLVIRFEDGSGVLLPVSRYPEFDGFDVGDYENLKVGFAGTALCHEGKDLACFHSRIDFCEPSLMDHGGLGGCFAQRTPEQRGKI
jgi:hypothetical protein